MADHFPMKVDEVHVCLEAEDETMVMANTITEITIDVLKDHTVKMAHTVQIIEAPHLHGIILRMAMALDNNTIRHARTGHHSHTMMAMRVVLPWTMHYLPAHLFPKTLIAMGFQMRLPPVTTVEVHRPHDHVFPEAPPKVLIFDVLIIHMIEIHTSRSIQLLILIQEVFLLSLVEEMTTCHMVRVEEKVQCQGIMSQFVMKTLVQALRETEAAHMTLTVFLTLLQACTIAAPEAEVQFVSGNENENVIATVTEHWAIESETETGIVNATPTPIFRRKEIMDMLVHRDMKEECEEAGRQWEYRILTTDGGRNSSMRSHKSLLPTCTMVHHINTL